MAEQTTEEAKRRGGSVPGKPEPGKPKAGKPKAGKPKPRSPSYPGINLEQAIDRARIIYQREKGKHEVAVDTVCAHWGVKPKTGAATVTLAALKAFGLLEAKHGADIVKLSDLLLRIILDTREDGTERREAIQKAALNPPMHRDMWRKGFRADQPSVLTVRYYLVKEKGFTEIGAEQLIAQYRATVAFANLGNGAIISSESEEEIPEQPVMTSPPPPPQIPEGRVEFQDVRIPDVRGHTAILRTPMPETEEECDYIEDMIRINVEAWKKAIARRLARQGEPDKDS